MKHTMLSQKSPRHKALLRQGFRRVAACTMLGVMALSLSLQPFALAFESLSSDEQQAMPMAMAAVASPSTSAGTSSVSRNQALTGQISIVQPLTIAKANQKVTLKARNTSLRDVLYILAQQGGFNIVLDASVDGDITVDLANVSVNKALEYIFTAMDLTYTKDGSTLIVAKTETANERRLGAALFKAFPVLYKDATEVANQMNASIFSNAKQGINKLAVVSADTTTNSLLILGSESDVQLVQQVLAQLDRPRNRRVYPIKYSSPNHVASMLAATLFNFGGAGGGAAPAGGGAAAPAGGAAAPAGGAAAAPAGGAAAPAGGAAGGGGVTPFTVSGVTFVPDPITATLTVMGTAEQLAMVDGYIDKVDIRRPQVSIELSLVEVRLAKDKTFAPRIGAIQSGNFSLSLLPAGQLGESALSFNTDDSFSFKLPTVSITSQLLENKTRILANPTLLAMDGQASTINITDEVATFSTSSTVSGTATILTTAVEKQNVGISLTVTPTITSDGSVTLNLAPTLNELAGTVTGGTEDAETTVPLIATRTVTVTAARIKDGQTLVIGGLLRERNLETLERVPGLSDLPIVGAMLRASTSRKSERSELLIMATPHIINEEATPLSQLHAQDLVQQRSIPLNGTAQRNIAPTELPLSPLSLPPKAMPSAVIPSEPPKKQVSLGGESLPTLAAKLK